MLVVVTGLLLLSAGGALAQGPPVEKETQRLVTSVSESLRQVLTCGGTPLRRGWWGQCGSLVIVLLPARSRCQGGARHWTNDLDAGEDRRTLVRRREPHWS